MAMSWKPCVHQDEHHHDFGELLTNMVYKLILNTSMCQHQPTFTKFWQTFTNHSPAFHQHLFQNSWLKHHWCLQQPRPSVVSRPATRQSGKPWHCDGCAIPMWCVSDARNARVRWGWYPHFWSVHHHYNSLHYNSLQLLINNSKNWILLKSLWHTFPLFLLRIRGISHQLPIVFQHFSCSSPPMIGPIVVKIAINSRNNNNL